MVVKRCGDNNEDLGVSGLRLRGREIHVLHRTVGCVVSESPDSATGALVGVGSQIEVGSLYIDGARLAGSS